MASNRYYPNSLPDYTSDGPGVIDVAQKSLKKDIADELRKIFHRLLTIEEQNLDKVERKGYVYTGTGGIAYMYFYLYMKDKDPSHLKAAKKFAETSLAKSSKRDVSFLCGYAGPLALSAVTSKLNGNAEEAKECVKKILNMLPQVLDLSSDIPNELLYGRVGYLYTLLFIKELVSTEDLDNAIKQVVSSIIQCGSSESTGLLMYTWHGKKYLGAAHGVWGILYLLLQVKQHLDEHQMSLIRQTVDYLLTARFPSGNFPSSLGRDEDKLVHWCHGAPGSVQMLLASYQTWKDERYLKAAIECGEVVWHRGLLRKGCGLCHGVAGNAYTFLALYQVTGDQRHVHRAVQFARWCANFDTLRERPADEPFSLFEGLAGTVVFLRDILDPANAMFPAFSLTPF